MTIVNMEIHVTMLAGGRAGVGGQKEVDIGRRLIRAKELSRGSLSRVKIRFTIAGPRHPLVQKFLRT